VAQYRGVVRWFNSAKGYGFLGYDGGQNVFVHYSAIEGSGYKTLRPGDQVEYDVIQGQVGAQAEHVRILKPSEDPSDESASRTGIPVKQPRALVKPPFQSH
jgi:CspA family cold shock protein